MKAIPNEGYFLTGKLNEIVCPEEDRPPIPPGLLIEAFDTLLCIRVFPLQARTKGAKIQFEFDISGYILISFCFLEVWTWIGSPWLAMGPYFGKLTPRGPRISDGHSGFSNFYKMSYKLNDQSGFYKFYKILFTIRDQ